MSESRQILEKGIEYALAHNSFNKVNMIESAKNVCVFGLGTYFREAFASKKIKETYKVNLVSDNDPDKWGREYEGLICVPPEELLKYEELVVIIMMGNSSQVEKQLDQMGIIWVTHVDLSLDDIMYIPKERKWFEGEILKIKKAYELFEEESQKIYANALCNRIAPPIAELSWQKMYQGGEYFLQPFMELEKDEVYVDCGAYTGDTVIRFIDTVKQYQEIHAFEIDRKNYEKMEKALSGMQNVFLYNEGVWDENKKISYGCGEGDHEPREGISIMKSKEGNQCIANVIKLDDIFQNKRVSFIKMDIEGAEIPALNGAENLIRRQRPKLAICVYHKTSDFWNIPLLLKQFVPEYKLRLRHHASSNCWGTVLYAY